MEESALHAHLRTEIESSFNAIKSAVDHLSTCRPTAADELVEALSFNAARLPALLAMLDDQNEPISESAQEG